MSEENTQELTIEFLVKKLQTAKEENSRLRNLLGKPYKKRIDLENIKLTQQNKQMREALEFYASGNHIIFSSDISSDKFWELEDDKRYSYVGFEDDSVHYEDGSIAQQAIKGGE
jgi:hypothetical protein